MKIFWRRPLRRLSLMLSWLTVYKQVKQMTSHMKWVWNVFIVSVNFLPTPSAQAKASFQNVEHLTDFYYWLANFQKLEIHSCYDIETSRLAVMYFRAIIARPYIAREIWQPSSCKKILCSGDNIWTSVNAVASDSSPPQWLI